MSSVYTLGISSFYHDSSAVILQNDNIIAAAQEERFTRKKFEKSFPKYSVDFCLKEAGITLDEVHSVAFYEDPLLKWDRLFTTYKHFQPHPFKGLSKLTKWLDHKLKVEDQIFHQYLKGFKGDILFSQHNLSHAASAFYPSPFEEATILIIDGIGEWSCTTIAYGKNKKIELLAEQRFPHSIGFLYSSFTQYLGFKVDNGEYKVMGLAPYGKPIYSDKILSEVARVNEEGELDLNLELFDFMTGSQMINTKFEEVFEQPRRKQEEKLEQFHFDMAASIQEVVEIIIQKIAKYAVELTGNRKLVMAGGVALNCVSNGKLLRESIVDELWIQPCSGDAGGALGAALVAAYQEHGLERVVSKEDSQKGSYLGPRFSDEEIQKTLEAFDFSYDKYETSELIDQVTDRIIDGKVIGFFHGRMEYGPRALGARSIIADPRNREMQEVLNLKIKFRESFRPFAPIVLESATLNWFEKLKSSPYMLLTTQVKQEKLFDISEEDRQKTGTDLLSVARSEVPAITHVNESARLQTITKERNGIVFDLLSSFEKKTGCPILINTSFNIRGEPIVCTPYDALQCFMNTNMDVLVLENFILSKEKQGKQLIKKEFMDYLNNG